MSPRGARGDTEQAKSPAGVPVGLSSFDGEHVELAVLHAVRGGRGLRGLVDHPGRPAADRDPVPAIGSALLATPVAASANSPVLILPDMAGSLGIRTATAAWLVTVFARA
ncbi:hypothetical protein [Streptomyces tanashiensis]|uniref:hypothetical protein n=1 Tax=Streptomyces tanashiensis TaxID=67367 RepID=UPI0034034962